MSGMAETEPMSIRISTALLIVVVLYCGILALPLILGGLLTGPIVFTAGIIHLLCAVVCYYLRLRILSKGRWARHLTISFSILVIVPLYVAAYQLIHDPDSHAADTMRHLFFVIVFLVIVVSLLRRDAAAWFDERTTGTGAVGDKPEEGSE
jgi:hypothetical protein